MYRCTYPDEYRHCIEHVLTMRILCLDTQQVHTRYARRYASLDTHLDTHLDTDERTRIAISVQKRALDTDVRHCMALPHGGMCIKMRINVYRVDIGAQRHALDTRIRIRIALLFSIFM